MTGPGHPVTPRRRGGETAAWLAPALLLVVALTQWLAAEVVPVSPWIGGGFGMFATVDGEDRVVTVDGIVASSASSRNHAVAPTARSATALRQEIGRPGEVIVWAPRYEVDSGRLTFEPIGVHPQP